MDFIRGAAKSAGGKPIIALPSTARNHTVSRIVPELPQGSSVVTTRGDVHYVVTEFGVARLWGKSLKQRALELIRIAHPDFHNDLLDQIKDKKYFHFQKELVDPESRYPYGFEKKRKFSGKELQIRPCRVTDQDRVFDFLNGLNRKELENEIYDLEEFLSPKSVREILQIDYDTSISLLGLETGEEESDVVAMANLNPGKERGVSELRLFVSDDYRKLGLGSYLTHRLIDFARTKEIGCVSVACHYENTAMKRIMEGMRKEFVSSMCRQESGKYICYYYLIRDDF